MEALRGALLRLAEERDEFHRSLEARDRWGGEGGRWRDAEAFKPGFATGARFGPIWGFGPNLNQLVASARCEMLESDRF